MEKHCTLSRKWKIFAALLLMVPILAVTGSAQAYFPPLPQDNEPFETAPLPPDASFRTDKPEINAGREKNSKLDSVMMELVAAAKISNQNALNLARSKSLRLHDNRVHVQIITSAAAHQQVTELVASAGGEVTGTSADSTLLQGWLPVDSLETLASNENVHRIQQPAEPVLLENLTAGSSTTEALAAINGLSWHSAGYTGVGVKIAIIDAGFDGYPALLGSDLPPSVTVKNFVDGETDGQVNGTTPHGTACAEIIYDIAPGASLYLVKIGTNLDLQEAVAWAKNTIQVDIISTSLGWYNLTPGDGTGEFADLVQSTRDAGILWTTAAGNDREAHWGGAFTDGDNDKYHNFVVGQNHNYFGPGDGNAYFIPAGYTFRVALRWDDWTAVNQDFDLYLYRYDSTTEEWGAPIAYSENVQNGGDKQTPTEYAYVVTSGADTAYGYAIYSRTRTRPVNFEVFAPKIAPLDEVVHERSLANLADAPAAFTVAALDAASPYLQEYYSSEGPTNGPGGTAAGGFTKPDISGFANVSTVSYGSGDYKFNGTSSATPHVAGAAALVLSAFPSYTPDQLQIYLQGRAIDMGSPGGDTVFGYGRLFLGDPPVVEFDHQVYLPIIMKPLPAPAAFNKVSPVIGAVNQSLTPTLSWGGTTPLTRYEYCYDITSDNACSSWINNGTSTSVSLPTLANDTTYYWQVRAWNSTAGPTYANGSATAFWSFTTEEASNSWNQLLFENFEGTFPGNWDLMSWQYISGAWYDVTSQVSWGKNSCQKYAGSYSGRAVGGGSQGGGFSCSDGYPDDIETWMIYGPFDLTQAKDGYLSLKIWTDIEDVYDKLFWGVSLDGDYFYGQSITENSEGWYDPVIDLKNVYTLGNVTGQSQVWIGVMFKSDYMNTYYEAGAWVDNISLSVCNSTGGCTGSPTFTTINLTSSNFKEGSALKSIPDRDYVP